MNRIRRMTPVVVGAFALMLVVHASALAQYEEPRRTSGFSEGRVLMGGVEWYDLVPRGTNPDSNAIAFRRVMPTLAFRQGPVEVVFGYTRYALHGDNHAAVYLGSMVGRDLPLAWSPSGGLVMPIVIGANYTRMELGGPERDNFSIAAIGLGTGLGYRATQRAFEFSAVFEGLVHYALEGLSTGSGFSGAVVGEASILLKDIDLGDGLCLGYRFRYQTWSLSDAQFNYRVATHGPFIGVSF